MSAEATLKAQNRLPLGAVILADLVIYWSALGWGGYLSIGAEGVADVLLRALTPVGGFLALLPLLPTLFLGVIPGEIRGKLAHWRLRNELPGSRAFTEIGSRDPRVDMALIEGRHGVLPDDPSAQNKLWYRIYTTHESTPAVRDAHGAYLLTRDMAAVSAFFFLTLVPALGVSIGWTQAATWLYCGLILLQHLLAALAAQNYGERLVATVLARESTSN